MSTVDGNCKVLQRLKPWTKIKELTNTFAEFVNTYRKTRKTVINS